jgi:hypothetical protein
MQRKKQSPIAKSPHAAKSRIWVQISDSFAAANKFDAGYYLAMGEAERLETVQLLRQRIYKLKKGGIYAGRKRLRRVIQVIRQI